MVVDLPCGGGLKKFWEDGSMKGVFLCLDL